LGGGAGLGWRRGFVRGGPSLGRRVFGRRRPGPGGFGPPRRDWRDQRGPSRDDRRPAPPRDDRRGPPVPSRDARPMTPGPRDTRPMPPRDDRRGPSTPSNPPPASRSADLEKKLDRLVQELEGLRREIRSRETH